MEKHEIKHLYFRAGFGILPNQLNKLQTYSRERVIDNLFASSKHYEPLTIDLSDLQSVTPKMLSANPKKRQEFVKSSRKRLLDLNIAWLDKLIKDKAVLRERMTLFWTNHFVCRDRNVIHVQQYNNTIRAHALGNFRAFAKAISKEAAMIKYLNLKQNRKSQPNENFARELMELFTLGTGHYTEQDIKESARAFTGYNHNFSGEFKLRKFQHDYGEKSFLGKSDFYDGDAIIDRILEKRECAKFVCEKVYKYFVNDIINSRHVESMTAVFYKDYNIENLMRFVFNSDWFYDQNHRGSKIKSPVDFLVGLYRIVPFELENTKILHRLQKLLGQTLFDPPNVAGWEGGKSWIDANTIMLRLKLPSLLLNYGVIVNNEFSQRFFKGKKSPFKSQPKWEIFEENFRNVRADDLLDYLISDSINQGSKSFINSLKGNDIKDYCLKLMSMPEYQMC